MTLEQRVQANLQSMLGDRDFQIALLAAKLDEALAEIEKLKKPPEQQPDRKADHQ